MAKIISPISGEVESQEGQLVEGAVKVPATGIKLKLIVEEGETFTDQDGNDFGQGEYLISSNDYPDGLSLSKKTGEEPTIILDSVPTVGAGDEIFVGYSSNSSGTINIQSSDEAIATVEQFEGYIKITGISIGDFDIEIVQAASGDFTSGSLSREVEVAEIAKDETAEYAAYTTGLAAVANGQEFSVVNVDEITKKVYLKTGGEGIYKRTVPTIDAPNIHTVNKAIIDEVAGEMPVDVHSDIDSTASMYHFNRLKSVLDSAEASNSLVNRPELKGFSQQGSITIDAIGDYGKKINAFEVTFPENVSAGHAPFLYIDETPCPAGKWCFQMDVKVADGDPDITLYYANAFSPSGSGYQPFTVTDEYSTIIFDSFHFTEDGVLTPYPFILAPGLDGNTPQVTFFLTNIKLVPGSAKDADNKTTRTLTMIDALPTLPNGSKNMLLDFEQLDSFNSRYQSFGSDLKDGSLAEYGTLIFAIRTEGDYSALYCWAENRVTYKVGELAAGKLKNTSWLGNLLLQSVVLNDGTYNVVAVTNDGTRAKAYLNGHLVLDVASTASDNYFNGLEFFGLNDTDFYSFDGEMSALAFWRRALSASEVLQGSEVVRKRLLYKGVNIPAQEVFLITEGDSITWMQNSYQWLLRTSYTPSMNGSCPAQNGAKLGEDGDGLSSNTLFGRREWVLAMAQEQLDLGKEVLLTINVGSNDLFTRLISSDAVIQWYSDYCAYMASFREIGVKVVASTIMDVAAISDKTYLEQVNALIRSDDAQYDGLADYYADPDLADASNTTYFYDGQHPTDAGFAQMLGIVKPVVDELT